MGKYTLHGSTVLDQHIDRDLDHIVKAIYNLRQSEAFDGVVLTGGYGRGDGTPWQTPQGERPFNDYDIVVVGRGMTRGYRHFLQQQLCGLQSLLSKQLGIEVDLFLHTQTSLRTASPSLMNYEMRYGHTVLKGPEDLLSVMPSWISADLSLDEGTRLLTNRGRLLLDVKMGLAGDNGPSESQILKFRKYLWKMQLAFGDCSLLAFGDYVLDYSARAATLASYRDRGIPNSDWMIGRYQRSVQFKRSGEPDQLDHHDLYRAYNSTVRYFLEFLLWYEGRRLGSPLPSLQTYCSRLPTQATSWLDRLKGFVRNTFLLGSGMAGPSLRWSYLHPRMRLAPALWLLLSYNGHCQLDLGLLQELLNGDRDYNTLLSRFNGLHRRLA